MTRSLALVSWLLSSSLLATVACGHKSAAPQPASAGAPPAPQDADARAKAVGGIVLNPSDGVRSAQGAFLVKVDWRSGPSASDYSEAHLTFADALGHQVQSIAGVTFSPWMPAMGHGTAMRAQRIVAVADAVGVFDVQQIDFIMGGDWELRIGATVNGVADTATVPAKVP